MRKEVLTMAAIAALSEVGASDQEIDEITNTNDIYEITTWDNHRIWARAKLVLLRARDVDHRMT